MPRINIKELGLTPEQAKNTFGGLPPEQIEKKVQELQTVQKQNQSQVETFTEKVKNLQGAKENPYKSMAVGSNIFSREEGGLKGAIYNILHPVKGTKDFVTGGKEGFIADVKNITSKETLDNLIAVKAAGGTFGSLTEKELDMLIDSATKVGQWEKTDDKGNTYYNVGEKIFDKEIERLMSLANKAITKAGGTPVPSNSGVTSSGIKYSIE